MTKWLEPTAIEIPIDLQNYVGGHPLVAKVLAQRGIISPSEAGGFLDHRLYRPASSTDLPNLAAAAERLTLALRNGEQICVWGDFDVDGQTSTTVLVSTLRELGAKVTYHIPVRGPESHGINVPVLKEVLATGVQVLLTCDTGIAEHEALAYAQAQGVDVVVTDHHTLPPTLPEAYALVNPQMLEADHPLRDLPGVGAAYKLAEELYRRAGRTGEAEALLDLVALGIVADVARQRADTRYLLQRGLEKLRHTERLGLQEMFRLADLNPAQLSEEHIGFALGPRLNALGRLGDANPIVEFLTTKDLAQAQVIAQQLESLNAERKLLTSQIYQGALAQLEADPSLLDFAALVVHHPAWEAGVIGIVAGRLAERFQRPAVVLTGEGVVRGSARSVEGVNITEAIAAQGEMLLSYGGHPMAAGVGLEAARLSAFRRALSGTVEKMRDGVEVTPLRIDAFLTLKDLSLELVEEIGRLAPFGAGNPALTLASRNLKVKNATVIGRTKEHLQIFVENEAGEVQKVFWWHGAEHPKGAEHPLPKGRFDLAYTVRASDYRGERQLQIEWVDFRPVEAEVREGLPTDNKAVEWVDFRGEDHPYEKVQALRAEGVQIWAEGEAKKMVGGVTREELVPGAALAVWSIPPGVEEWRRGLEAAQPGKVYLFAGDEEEKFLEGFIKRLAGLLKFAVKHYQGQIGFAKLAGATGQREATVRQGMAWMAAKGWFEVDIQAGEARVRAGDQVEKPELATIEARLQGLWEETRAFRKFWTGASVKSLTREAKS